MIKAISSTQPLIVKNIYQKTKQNSSTNNLSFPSFEGKFSNGEEKPKHIKPYYAQKNFLQYNPRIINFDTYKIPVHNEEITKRLKKDYTKKEFEELFKFVQSKGTFSYALNPQTGFVKTSLINHTENNLMSDLIWITDSCHNLELVKYQDPKACTKVFNKLSKFYDKEQKSFDEIIANPSLYKHNGFWPQGQKGVGHCFDPKTSKPHVWYAKTRLESIGNYLQRAVDLILTGHNQGNYGYSKSIDIPQEVINSISNSVKYLYAIHYPSARSCGAWEEQTFVNSLTSDTAIINQSIRDILKLMYSESENKELLKTRERILNSQNGDVFNNPNALKQILIDGETRILSNYQQETTKGFYNKKLKIAEKKCLNRDYDAAMSFVFQTEKLDENVQKDSIKKLLILQKLCNAIVRQNGAIRYQGDEYINLDYHIIKNPWTDNKKKNEAEWFLVSEIANAYGSVVKNLLEDIEQNGSSEINQKLLKIALSKQTEYINRSYARITPKNMTKSNSYSCPAYKLPEAYEAVTTSNGKIKFVPGAHTPLTWAQSSLLKASNLFIENLEHIEKLF